MEKDILNKNYFSYPDFATIDRMTWEELDRRHTINLYNAYHPEGET